jgi:hypothetical protein
MREMKEGVGVPKINSNSIQVLETTTTLQAETLRGAQQLAPSCL